jgi:hypothetical protein
MVAETLGHDLVEGEAAPEEDADLAVLAHDLVLCSETSGRTDDGCFLAVLGGGVRG